jgi:hypothetical protein
VNQNDLPEVKKILEVRLFCLQYLFPKKRNSFFSKDATLSITQRPKSLARSMRNKNLADRSTTVGDSMDTTLQHVRPLGKSNNLRIEADDDKSDKELSESLKSATFNQTHTIANGKFRPTQSPTLNRSSFRSTNDDLKPIKTGALDRTVRLNKDSDDLTKPNNRFPAIDKSPGGNTRFDRSSPPTTRKQQDSDDDRSSSEEQARGFKKKPEPPPPTRNERKASPLSRRRNDSESDDNKSKRPSPVKTSASETLNRKTRLTEQSDEDEEEEDEEEEENPRFSSRQNKKQPPPTAARRSSLPHQTNSGASISSTRDGNQTIGSKPVDGVRGSFRSQATKTLAKPNTSTQNTDSTKKEATPAPQPGFFRRIFGSKPASPPPPPPPPTTASANPNSRTCSIM